MSCGHPGIVSEIEWQFVQRQGDKDVYRFTRRFPVDGLATTVKSNSVEFASARVVVFQDQWQAVVMEPDTEMERLMGGQTPRFLLHASDIASASAAVGSDGPGATPRPGAALVHSELARSKVEEFRRFTKEHVNHKVQILLGTRLIAEPIVRSEISGGKFEVSFQSSDEARAIAKSLSEGRR
jgi:preprotein translocase subunit SecD